MEIDTVKNCSFCGSPSHTLEAYCSFCGQPLREMFADPSLVETCRQFLQDMEARLNEIPPAPGWRILLLWFGSPLVTLVAFGLLMKGLLGWLIGLLTAVLLFFLLTPVIAALRSKLRLRQYHRFVKGRLIKLMQNKVIQLEDLILLAQMEEDLKQSLILEALKAICSSGDLESVEVF